MAIRLAASTLTCLLALLVTPNGQAQTDANVLLVVLDDWGVDWLGVYGEAGVCSDPGGDACSDDGDCTAPATCETDYPSTPAIDRIAAEGLLFRNAWANPVCTPTRASFLTGRHGFRTGVTNVEMGQVLAPEELTVAEVLQDPVLGGPHGHESGLFGKWHVGGNQRAPNDQGFLRFTGVLGGALPDYFSWMRSVDGMRTDCSPGSADCPTTSYVTSVLVDDALDWIGTRTNPWFAILALTAPHTPLHVPPHELLPDATLARLPQVGGAPAPAGTVCDMADSEICYLAMVEAADAEIGRLMDSLSDPVHVILIGDNGTPRAAIRPPFDAMHGKNSLYEGGVNVPFLFRAADGRAAGRETAAFAHAVDIFATVLELTCSLPPTDRPIDGRSLVPLLDDPDQPWAEFVYTQLGDEPAIRGERYKLIERAGGDEFYDLQADPHEQDDLFGMLSDAELAALDELRRELQRLQEGSGRVPDGRTTSGAPLLVTKEANGDLSLDWDPSCWPGDSDYAVYEGPFTNFQVHFPLECSTAGATELTTPALDGSRHFLIVPQGEATEGSYGRVSVGPERAPFGLGCQPWSPRDCPWQSGCSP